MAATARTSPSAILQTRKHCDTHTKKRKHRVTKRELLKYLRRKRVVALSHLKKKKKARVPQRQSLTPFPGVTALPLSPFHLSLLLFFVLSYRSDRRRSNQATAVARPSPPNPARCSPANLATNAARVPGRARECSRAPRCSRCIESVSSFYARPSVRPVNEPTACDSARTFSSYFFTRAGVCFRFLLFAFCFPESERNNFLRLAVAILSISPSLN